MKYNPERHDRHSIRLRGHDYAGIGAYFVTICLNRRIPHVAQGQTHVAQGQTHVAQGQTHVAQGQTHVAQGQPHVAQGQTHRSAPTGTQPEFGFPTFGLVKNGVMLLNDSGKMVQKYILEIVNNTDKFFNIKINEYVIMPDHIHGIIKINDPSTTNPPVGADLRVCPFATNARPYLPRVAPNPIELGTIIQWLKTMTTNEYTNGVKTFKWKPFHKKLWQRNYYERIIRNETEYARIAEYIRNNPILWEKAR